MRCLRVLVSAYACEPNKGSEPGVGWNWVKQIARFHEVWVITRANNREAIERVLEEEPMPNVHWVYFDLPRWARFWKKGQRGVHLYYYLWQIGAYFVGKRLHREVKFDLVHHVTFVNYWMPSFLVLLSVPFIWGPVGGGESTPIAFYRSFSFRGRMYEYVRNMARWIGEHDPFVKLTARRTWIALATTPETEGRIKRLGCPSVQVLSQVAILDEEIVRLKAIPMRNSNPFRLVSIGRLLHLKGFHLGIEAFARFQKWFTTSEYWLIGDGPERRNLQRVVQELGIAEKVRFWGNLPRQEVLKRLAECDVLVHPSFHDSGGLVCLEAMASGRPVICLDLGGPALQVTEETGFKIPAHLQEKVIHDMAEAMLKLAKDPELRWRMGEAARRRVTNEFSWDKKGEWINRIYDGVIKHAYKSAKRDSR